MKSYDSDQNRADSECQFPDADGFFYSGPSPRVWAGYLKNRLIQTLNPLPQERNIRMVARWAAQRRLERRDVRVDRAWARVGELIRTIRESGEEAARAGLSPGEEDLSPLTSLTGLRELSLPFNLISDLSPLAKLDKLVQLKVYGNQITSLEPLRGLTNLNVLNLRDNPLEPGTLACLRKCKRLGMLDLSNTGLKDIRDLEFCRAWNLDLYDNPDLTGVEVISTMKRLCCLYIDTETARRYDIQALAPQLTEYGELDGISLYVWPEEYYN